MRTPGQITELINRKITKGRRLCEADIKVALQLIEQIFSIRSCSTNGHNAVFQLVRNMETKGAPRPELGIGRTVHCIAASYDTGPY